MIPARCSRGNAFVAISGFATDGNRYISKAMDRGACLVVTEQVPSEPVPYVQVASARGALASMGANWYGHPAQGMTMVGVTGTNGKTSVTLLLKTVLEQVTGAKVGLIGTIQNMIGQEVIPTERTTPESFALQGLLARMAEAGCRYVVMEVSSHALALDRVGASISRLPPSPTSRKTTWIFMGPWRPMPLQRPCSLPGATWVSSMAMIPIAPECWRGPAAAPF